MTAGTDGLPRFDGAAFISALVEDRPSAALLDGARARLGASHPERRLTIAAIAADPA